MQQSAKKLSMPSDLFSGEGALDALTFSLMNTRYAIPISQVRYIEQDTRKSTRVDMEEGAREVTTYQGSVVPIVDFARLAHIKPAYEENLQLISTLDQRERDHVNWLNALEDSVMHGSTFSLTTDPHQCAFGQWYDHFKAEDELLADIMQDFDAPHKRIHGLADLLLGKAAAGKRDEAIQQLQVERATTMVKLKNLFEVARDRLRSITRPVLVFVNRADGKLIAIRLDAIDDIQIFASKQYAPYDSMADMSGRVLEVIVGYLHDKQSPGAPYILLDWRFFRG